MKKSLLATAMILSLVSSNMVSIFTQPMIQAEESSHDHDHDEDDEHDHEDHDHEHAFEFDAKAVVKKEDDHYILIHGDHYHKIAASELSEEEIKVADEHLAAHPELAAEYEAKQQIYNGYFEDEQVKDRTLEDWEGDWQSVLPYLEDGTLAPVMAMKASKEGATMTAEEYTQYYTVGYATDVTNIVIDDNEMSFETNGEVAKATYKYDGYRILQYEKGNRGVRYLFTKESGDEAAPMSIQFSDHNIAPNPELTHFHIYMSNDSHDELVNELENWPTYYPTEWNGGQILADQLNH